MKPIKFLSAILFLFLGSATFASALDVSPLTAASGLTAAAFIFKAMPGVAFMATTPDLSAITTGIKVWGTQMLRKMLLEWDLSAHGVMVYKNVKQPMLLPKMSAQGKPMPYREQDDTTGRGVKITDRELAAYMAKYDYDFEPEKLRNTYLASVQEKTFEQWVGEYCAKAVLDAIITDALYLGVRNAAGTDTVDICDGWGTILAALITATTVTPIVTGAITSTNAVEKVELVANGVLPAMKRKGYRLYVSHGTFEKYGQDYRTRYGYQFNPNLKGQFTLDNKKAIIEPVDWMGTSQRIIATVDGNLCAGTDLENVSMHPSMRRDIIESRQKFAIGCQIADPELIFCNDQA